MTNSPPFEPYPEALPILAKDPAHRDVIDFIKEVSCQEGRERHENELLIDEIVEDTELLIALRTIAAQELVIDRQAAEAQLLVATEQGPGLKKANGLKAMNAKDVSRALVRAGLVRQKQRGRNDHRGFYNPETGMSTCIGIHRHELGPALIKKIIDRAGLTVDQFLGQA